MSSEPATPIDRLLSIMRQLRDPQNGCEWDHKQSFATIAPYTIEEAYEVADAIERNDIRAIKNELGDLLLQVVFHARIAEEAAHFDFDDVATSIVEKLKSRHPHIFGDEQDSDEPQNERWERIKAAERTAEGASSALDGIATALPALLRAEKLQRRVAGTGFDWPDITGPLAKLAEELDELANAKTAEERLMEAGDVLFAAVNVVRHHGIAPEDALRAANTKFDRRFREMERVARNQGEDIGTLPLDRQEAYWQAAKASEG